MNNEKDSHENSEIIHIKDIFDLEISLTQLLYGIVLGLSLTEILPRFLEGKTEHHYQILFRIIFALMVIIDDWLRYTIDLAYLKNNLHKYGKRTIMIALMDVIVLMFYYLSIISINNFILFYLFIILFYISTFAWSFYLLEEMWIYDIIEAGILGILILFEKIKIININWIFEVIYVSLFYSIIKIYEWSKIINYIKT